MKIIWRVSEAPTGPYRSFSWRAWPAAYYGTSEGPPCAIITCDDEYIPAAVREGKHAELSLSLADHSLPKPGAGAFTWRRLKQRFATLDEAKAAVLPALEHFSHFKPEGL